MNEFRAIKLNIERAIGAEIPTEANIIEWIVEHAVYICNHVMVGEDGKTAQMRLTGRKRQVRLVEMGEMVLAKVRRKKKTMKKTHLQARWMFGTWLGIANRTNENLVALDQGGDDSESKVNQEVRP